jgi:hypothetical protein
MRSKRAFALSVCVEHGHRKARTHPGHHGGLATIDEQWIGPHVGDDPWRSMQSGATAALRAERNFGASRDVVLRQVVEDVRGQHSTVGVKQVKRSHVAADASGRSSNQAFYHRIDVGRARYVLHAGHEKLGILRLHGLSIRSLGTDDHGVTQKDFALTSLESPNHAIGTIADVLPSLCLAQFIRRNLSSPVVA